MAPTTDTRTQRCHIPPEAPQWAGLWYLEEIAQQRSCTEITRTLLAGGSNRFACHVAPWNRSLAGRTAETEQVDSSRRRVDHVHIDFRQF
ncbi:hypothetical protein, partial [Rhizobium leguminosarum]|uniref:hypothetical protein n=1 Tax=Rhizobium leguminosarum TaxID=384 RepID=UPI003F995F9F